jgi:hypothetical protein
VIEKTVVQRFSHHIGIDTTPLQVQVSETLQQVLTQMVNASKTYCLIVEDEQVIGVFDF